MGNEQTSDAPLLPEGLEADLDSTVINDTDQITDLQGKLTIAEDALTDEQEKNNNLEAELKLLRENSPIKVSAVKFAKWYLFLIPIFSLALLIISANKGFELSVASWQFQWAWNFELGNYTQSALVIAPIAFIATVIGFMIKGVFGQQGDKDGLSTNDVLKFLAINK